jgi:hypothetical protein
LEPILVIIFGLLITAGGVGWQLSRASAPATAAQQANAAPVNASVPPPPPPKPFLSEAEKTRIADSLNSLSATLDDFSARIDAEVLKINDAAPTRLALRFRGAVRRNFFNQNAPPPPTPDEMIADAMGAVRTAKESYEKLGEIFRSLQETLSAVAKQTPNLSRQCRVYCNSRPTIMQLARSWRS